MHIPSPGSIQWNPGEEDLEEAFCEDIAANGEGDVFVGGAFNVLVGTNRVVDINLDNCQIELDTYDRLRY